MSDRWTVIHGDVREVLPTLAEALFDGVLCDPPYELGFMGKRWDASGVAFDPKVWAAVLRALRPGAPLLGFGGTRTYHRMTCAIEDAGFEIRDCLSYLYGSGFPKSLDVSKAIDKALGHWRGRAGLATSENGAMSGPNYERTPKGPPIAAAAEWSGYGTALKPAWEPCVLARRPLDGTIVENVGAHGVGGLAIDSCRISYVSEEDKAAAAAAQRACLDQNAGRTAYGEFSNGPASLPEYFEKQALGRWPANVLLEHDARCARIERSHLVEGESNTIGAWECVADCPVRLLDEQSGDRPGRRAILRNGGGGKIFNGGGNAPRVDAGYDDFGGASRFFFTSKVSSSERNDGLDDLPELDAHDTTGRDPASAGNGPRAGAARGAGAPRYRCSACGLHLGGGRAVTPCPSAEEHVPVLIGYGAPSKNPHPTMKPVALTEYLAKLILPPRGIGRARRLLVPFCGVASEMVGALRAGWDEVVGVEFDEMYVRIARLRLARVDVAHQPSLFDGVGT